MSRRLNLGPAQRRFLTFFPKVDPCAVRDRWLGAVGVNLGPVVDHRGPPPGAERVKVWAALAGEIESKGADRASRVLALDDLAALDPLWAKPLRALNAEGLRYAEEAASEVLTETVRLDGRATPISFKLRYPVTAAELEAQAIRERRTKSEIVRDAISDYLERRG